MTLFRTLAAVFLATGIACSGTAAAARLDPDHYLITQDVVNRMKAIEADFDKSGYRPLDDDSDDSDDSNINNGRGGKKSKKDGNPTPEELVRQIESNKEAMAALKRHGLTSRDFALTSFAMLHAGFYVMFEDQMDKKGAADMFARFTKEQRANVAFMRTMKKQEK